MIDPETNEEIDQQEEQGERHVLHWVALGLVAAIGLLLWQGDLERRTRDLGKIPTMQGAPGGGAGWGHPAYNISQPPCQLPGVGTRQTNAPCGLDGKTRPGVP